MHINFINPSIFIYSETFKNALNLGELARYLNGDIFYYYDKTTRSKLAMHLKKNTLTLLLK